MELTVRLLEKREELETSGGQRQDKQASHQPTCSRLLFHWVQIEWRRPCPVLQGLPSAQASSESLAFIPHSMNFQVLLAFYIRSCSTLDHGQGRRPDGNNMGSASFPSCRNKLLGALLPNLAFSFGQVDQSIVSGILSTQWCTHCTIFFSEDWAMTILPHPAIDVNMPEEIHWLYLCKGCLLYCNGNVNRRTHQTSFAVSHVKFVQEPHMSKALIDITPDGCLSMCLNCMEAVSDLA